MDAILKQKWIDALRSGEYKQTKGRLRSTDKKLHCCLGVFCEVADIPISEGGLVCAEENSTAYGPIREAMGVPSVEPFWKMNDVQKLTFPEIATYIEQNL